MSDPIQIQVSTQSLRRILEDNPEVMLRLNSMACEKIAEQISVKAKTLDLSVARHILSEELKRHCDALKTTYRFPREAEAVIEKYVATALKDGIGAELRAARLQTHAQVSAEVTHQFALLKTSFDKMIYDADRHLADTIKRLAREEFLAVLAEVKSGVAS